MCHINYDDNVFRKKCGSDTDGGGCFDTKMNVSVQNVVKIEGVYKTNSVI